MISPSWTTYKPQARLAHHEPFVIETGLKDAWKISPKIIDDVNVNTQYMYNSIITYIYVTTII